jgi:tetratricopeptide (TPR) repeat protein
MDGLHLGALPRRASEALARSALGDDAPRPLVERLAERGAGNALYLEELIRAAAGGHDADLPGSVLAMIAARLEGLEPHARRVLRAASVFGQQFRPGAVARLLGEDVEQARASLDDLVAREIVLPRRNVGATSGGEGYAFRHALFRDAAYALLTGADRALGHRLAAEWLEGAGEGDPATIAEHFELGGLPARAARHHLAAAEQAAARFEAQAALDFARRAVRGGLAGEKLGRARLVEATAELWWGTDVSSARGTATAALELLPRGGDPWCEAVGIAVNIAQMLGQREWLLALVDDLERAGSSGSAYLQAAARSVARLVFAGEIGRAAGLLAVIDEGMRAETDMMTLGSYYQARAMLAVYTGDQHEALDLVDRAARCYERAGNQRGVAIQRTNWGTVAAEHGRYDEAERALREAQEVARSLGSSSAEAAAGHNLGAVLGRLGRLDEGLAIEETAARSFASRGDLRLEGSARTYVAEIHALAGRLDAAEAELERALACLAGAPSQRALALAVLARVRLDRGRPEDALAPAEEAYGILVSLGGLEERESLVRLRWAEALAASGRDDDAADILEEAAARLLARADRIAEPAWRERFLQGVPENARTLELAARPQG